MAAGATVAAGFAAVVAGITIANVLIHPEGTKAAADGVVNILRPTYSALLGAVPAGYATPAGAR